MKAINFMKLIIRKFFLMLFVVLGGIGICSAQLPTTQTQGGITYISGGIGEDEAKAIKDESKNWPLSIDFSEHLVNEDLWIAQVYLKILDSKGKTLFEARVEGPMFLGKVPPGSYELLATYEGVTQSKKIQIVDGKPLHVSINWRLSKGKA